MITLFQVDKSGRDIFEKDYSVVLIVDKKEIYGINIPQEIKDKIMYEFKQGKLWKPENNEKRDKLRLRIRFHTSIIIILMLKAIRDHGFIDELNIEICNDFDGHFHEIKDMVYKNISKIIPMLKREDILQTKFQKPSLIDTAARELREKVHSGTDKVKINLEELMRLMRK